MDVGKLANEEILFLYLTHKKTIDYIHETIRQGGTTVNVGPMLMFNPVNKETLDELTKTKLYKLTRSIVDKLFYMVEIIGSDDEYKYILEIFDVDEVEPIKEL